MFDKTTHTVVQCLTALAQHHGIQIHPERLLHDYALADVEPPLALLLRRSRVSAST